MKRARFVFGHLLAACCLGLSSCAGDDSAVEPDRPAAEPAGATEGAPVALEDLNADGARFGPAPGGGSPGNEDGGAAPVEFEYKALKDAAGRTTSYLPLPKDWRVSAVAGGLHRIDGPHGIVVNPTESAQYSYAADAFALETLQLTGAQISPVLPVQQIIDEGIVPAARAQGYTLVDTYPLPEIEKFWDDYMAAMPGNSSRREQHVVGTDWQNEDGDRSLIVLLQTIAEQGKFTTWSVHTTELEAPEGVFESAKAIYLDGLANLKMDAEWQRDQNQQLVRSLRRIEQESQAQMRASAARHRQRMADIESFGRTARSIGEINSQILDDSHRGFRERSAMQSAGQSNSVQAIHERRTVAHPVTGKRYEVRAGYRFYWSDGRGGYFGTDDPNYDPRTDSDVNDREWVRLRTDPR